MRIEDLLHAITPLMGQQGLAVLQNEIEIKTVETRVAVTYEFTVIHESGEIWPGMRKTGMSNARDSKGGWDDKSLNKCHTSARKYFLLSLFQVPSGEFDDPDADEDKSKPTPRAPVPGPRQATKEETHAETQTLNAPPDKPQRIGLGKGAGAEGWAQTYLQAIGKAKSREEIIEWDKLNDETLQKIHDGYPHVYERLKAAVERRLSDLEPKNLPEGMPDPKKDAQETMNWIATQLLALKSMEAVEAFWNEMVAPHERDFDITDWEMLMKEYERAETRLGTQQLLEDEASVD